MGEPLVGISAGGRGSGLCFCHNTSKEAGVEHSLCARCLGQKFEAGIACGVDDLAVQEIGSTLSKVLHVCDVDGSEGSDSGSSLGESSEENDVPPLSPISGSTYDLVDTVESEVLESSLARSNGSKINSAGGKSSNGSSSPNSAPVLVSAMKGSRTKHGTNSKLSVKWAPDVYDPPVTSDSHTVKSCQKSLRSKNYYKQQFSKSSSGGNKKDKKHCRYSSSSSSSSNRDKKNLHHSSRRSNNTAGARRLLPVECASAFPGEEYVLGSTVNAREHEKCSISYRKEQPMVAVSPTCGSTI